MLTLPTSGSTWRYGRQRMSVSSRQPPGYQGICEDSSSAMRKGSASTSTLWTRLSMRLAWEIRVRSKRP